MKKSFYSNLNSLPPVGSGTAVDSTCEMVTDDNMLTTSFVDTLNGATGDTVTWIQSKYGDTCFNEGYPTIEGRFLQNRALTLMNGMTLRGPAEPRSHAYERHDSQRHDAQQPAANCFRSG